MPQVGSSSKANPANFTSSVLQVMRVRSPAPWMVSPWLIQTALPAVMPAKRRSEVSMWVKWARPYSRLSLASTLPPPFWANHWAPKHTPNTGHCPRMPSRSGAGALASRTLCGLPERMTPFQRRPCGSSSGAVSSRLRQSPFQGLISAKVFNSLTRRAMSWVYWDPKSRMRMLSMRCRLRRRNYRRATALPSERTSL